MKITPRASSASIHTAANKSASRQPQPLRQRANAAMASARYSDRKALNSAMAKTAIQAGKPPYRCRLMNSHQVPAASQAVPKTRPSAAARRGVAFDTRHASSATSSICKAHAQVWTNGKLYAAPSTAATSASKVSRMRPIDPGACVIRDAPEAVKRCLARGQPRALG